jgi:hypothetical protein
MARNRALLVVVFVVLVLGAYASWLNHQFYLHQAPFFDSAPYVNYLARVIGITQSTGASEGWSVALTDKTTPLPGLEALLLAMLHVPISSMRQLGVWLQVIWLLAFAVSLHRYWTGARGAGPWTGAILTLPFLAFAAVFKFNGGLPDFRLDFSLYTLLSTSAVWYLYTYFTESRVPWLLGGVFLILSILSRAIAPAYAAVMIGPVLFARLAAAPPGQRRRLAQGAGWMLLPAGLVVLPYFIFNFNYLYFYYVQQNADANANLPFRIGVAHLTFAAQHLGPAVGAAAFAFFLVVLLRHIGVLRERGLASLHDFDWKLLYMGFAPALFLVLRGAGLNPFLSMPAVFGVVAFLLAPLKTQLVELRSRSNKAAAVLVVAACLWNAARAPGQVAYPETHIQAIRQGIEWMREDSLRRKLLKVDFVTLHNWNFQVQFVRNVLINEYGYREVRPSMLSPEGVTWMRQHVWDYNRLEGFDIPFNATVPLIWDKVVEGTGDAQKIEWLLSEARNEIDYVFIPDEATIDFMEKYISHNFINTKVRAIRKRFLESGEWKKIGTPLAITDFERVELYARRLQP